MKDKIAKYQSYQLMDLPDRQWPSKKIEKAPIWCSVDLRDGNQALQDPMNLQEKMTMFRTLVNMGFKEIEIGFPAASEVEFRFMRELIAKNMIPDDVTVQVLTQAREPLIVKTFESIEGAKRAIVHLYNSTSTLQREVVFNMDQAGITKIATEGVKCIKGLAAKETGTEIVFQYSPESFTGTEMDFAMNISNAVMDVWQPTPENKAILNLPSTVEMSTPNIFADQIEWFDRNLKNRESIIISIHNHNDRGTAVASSELAIMAGADRIEGTLFGNGERTGNVDIVTLGLNMFTQGVDPELDFTNINSLIQMYENCSKMPVHQRHPYAGELVYTAFSGSHQDAINKGMKRYKESNEEVWGIPYLPIDPQDVGRTYEAIVRINSQSGKGGAAYIMDNEFGFNLPKKMHPEFGSLVQKISDESGIEVKTDQIWQCFEDNYLKNNTPYQLTRFSLQTAPANGDGSVKSKIQTLVEFNNESVEINGEGNGPIDAFCNGMRDTFKIKFKLMGYYEHALEISSSAEAAAYIQIQHPDGQKSFGVGVDTNISVASLKALISALNRMELMT
jgi:2-isopropylmalate synthase